MVIGKAGIPLFVKINTKLTYMYFLGVKRLLLGVHLSLKSMGNLFYKR